MAMAGRTADRLDEATGLVDRPLPVSSAARRDRRGFMNVRLRRVHRAGAKALLAGIAASALMVAATPVVGAVPSQSQPRNSGYPTGSGGATAANTGPTSLDVPTLANIDPGTSKTNIECAWSVPDLNAAGGAETSNTNTGAPNFTGNPFYGGAPPATPPSLGGTNAFQYSTGPNPGGLDDDPTVTPVLATGASATPCDLGTAASQVNPGSALQADGAQHMIQVLPNADDNPAQRRMELWAAVDDTTGLGNANRPQISDVYWDIYKPDGTLKFEVHGVPLPPVGTPGNLSGPCSGPAGMFNSAINNGELTNAAVNDPVHGIIALCSEGVKQLWHNAWTISKDQPSGVYKVVTHAVDAGGALTSMTYSIDIIPFFDLAIDFSKVDFGAITPNASKTIAGDGGPGSFDPPNSTTPTVTNEGNSGEQIGVQFSPLIGAGTGKCIPNFDAALGLNALGLEHISPISATCTPPAASNIAWFAISGTGPGKQLLCPNDDAKLDISVEPGSVPSDTYAGSMMVWARSDVVTGAGRGGCPTDNGKDYVPNSGTRF
jgi:hypothetical protein